jgi:hypothetical protein
MFVYNIQNTKARKGNRLKVERGVDGSTFEPRSLVHTRSAPHKDMYGRGRLSGVGGWGLAAEPEGRMPAKFSFCGLAVKCRSILYIGCYHS